MTREEELRRRYAQETEPGEVAVRRVVAEARGRREARWRWRWAPLLAVGAGLVALVVGVAVRDEPGEPPPAGPAALWSPDVERRTDAGDGIALAWRGGGTLDGDRLTWESGEVSVEVPPGQGLHFTVATREGEVRVVGTGFGVARDVLGTRVSVRHGRVAVRCGGEAEVGLGAGETKLCLPVSAPSLLARAHALRDAQAPPAEILETLDAGLALASPGAAADELRYLRAALADERGDTPAALADLEPLVATPGSPRRTDALRMRAGIALREGECAAATRWLDELIAGQPRAVDLVMRARCASHPSGARADLERALTLHPDPTTEAEARRALASLLPQ